MVTTLAKMAEKAAKYRKEYEASKNTSQKSSSIKINSDQSIGL